VRAWLAHDITRTHVSTEVNQNVKEKPGARQNTWKYSVKTRKPEMKRARNVRFYLQGLLGDQSFGGKLFRGILKRRFRYNSI